MDILIGADPELFVKKNGVYVSGHNLIEGTKDKPFKVPFGAVQVDGMALEFNIDPASTQEEFLHNIKSVKKTLKKMVPDYELVALPVADFDPEYFANEVPPEAKVLGCDPDYNAWTGKINEPPKADAPFRTASGHIHIGWTEGADVNDPYHFSDCMTLVRQLDYTLGMYSLLWDKDNRRRNLYGQAGAFRPKPYGVEYRVMSNMWLNSEALIKWVFRTAVRSTEALANGKSFEFDYGNAAKNHIERNNGAWGRKGYCWGLKNWSETPRYKFPKDIIAA